MENLLKVKNLKKYFPVEQSFWRKSKGIVKAVDGISFNIEKGEILGLVGESGCGKTTTGRIILRLLEPTAGEVYFKGKNIFNFTKKELYHFRRQVQVIFQNPFASLNPRMTIGSIIAEPLQIHKMLNKKLIKERVKELLNTVGLDPRYYNRYPHEFSGGERQRIGIARAISLNPALIIADEPVSSLDMIIQTQIIELLMNLQKKRGLAYLFITHDLNVIKHISQRVAVMYLGKIVELGSQKQIYSSPQHSYTQRLLSSIPKGYS